MPGLRQAHAGRSERLRPEDYAGRESAGAVGSSSLEIVYTGGIYPGRRDPTPLFRALALMPEGAGGRPRALLWDRIPTTCCPLPADGSVRDRVIVHPHVSRG